jgi:fermentation-respiration switch protein FrsA (DUF1100 family)
MWFRRMIPWVAVVLLAYLAVVLAFWIGQNRLIYYPGPTPGPPPASAILDLREEWIETKDGERLHAWLATPRAAKGDGIVRGVLVCHGNAGNIASRVPVAEAFASSGFTTLLFDYRGYGGSTGKPTEKGTYLDAEAAFDRFEELLRPLSPTTSGSPSPRIAVYGESLGGAVAIELARRRKVARLLVEDTFTSLADIASGLYPWLPARTLLRNRYASIDKVGAIGVPLLVIHSPQDDLVPFALGRKLFDAAREPKTFLETGGRHDEGGFLEEERWRSAVRSFLEEVP